MYTYAHLEDALENITHSICTLEFEDQRPFYDWVLERLAMHGKLQRPLPQQIEFARLKITHTVMSKRFFLSLIDGGHVDGWDDPRMPTLAEARRRGFTPEGFRLFAERIGVSKADSWIDPSVLEDCMPNCLRRGGAAAGSLDPLIIANYPRARGRVLRAQPPAAHGVGQAAHPLLARAVDRARGLQRGAAQGLLPPLPRQHGAAQVRLRREVHGLHEGRTGR